MAKAPAFPFYAADYLADENVTLMTLEEEGALARAKAYCWREGSIPADESKLSRLLKNASNQTTRVVRECFVPCPNDASRLIYPGHEEARERQRIWKEKSAEAGKKSGQARREKKLHAEPTFNQPSNLVEPKSNSSFALASPSSSSSIEEISDAKASSPRRDAAGDEERVRPEQFAEAWNQRCGPLPKVEKFTSGRKRQVIARIRSGLTIDRFIEAVENCRVKPFLAGDNDRGWVATFDWLMANAENAEKAITVPYGANKAGHGNGASEARNKPTPQPGVVPLSDMESAAQLVRDRYGDAWGGKTPRDMVDEAKRDGIFDGSGVDPEQVVSVIEAWEEMRNRINARKGVAA